MRPPPHRTKYVMLEEPPGTPKAMCRTGAGKRQRKGQGYGVRLEAYLFKKKKEKKKGIVVVFDKDGCFLLRYSTIDGTHRESLIFVSINLTVANK